LQGEDTARTARTMITNPRPRPSTGQRSRCTAPEPTACGERSSPGFQVGVIRCRALLLGFRHCSANAPSVGTQFGYAADPLSAPSLTDVLGGGKPLLRASLAQDVRRRRSEPCSRAPCSSPQRAKGARHGRGPSFGRPQVLLMGAPRPRRTSGSSCCDMRSPPYVARSHGHDWTGRTEQCTPPSSDGCPGDSGATAWSPRGCRRPAEF
jgi:hypothetical protein